MPRAFKNRSLSLLLSAVLTLSLSAATFSQSPLPTARPAQVGFAPLKLKRIDLATQRFISNNKIAGAVTIVAKDGKVAYFKAIGHADKDAQVRMKKDTIFRIYSMTKPIASTALMMLIEEGKVSLDDPVAKYLPAFKNAKVFVGGTAGNLKTVAAKRPPNVADLLRHTSGLTYGFFGNTPVDQMYRRNNILKSAKTLNQFTETLGKIPLQYHPGEQWLYSVSIDVIGALVEAVSKQPLDQFLEKRIFKPLKMKDTAFFVAADKVDRFAVNYGPTDQGGLRVVDGNKNSVYLKKPNFLSGGGGLTSTAHDYMRFCQMILDGGELDGKRLLKTKTVQLMIQNQLPKAAYPIGFGKIKRKGVGFGYGFSVVVKKSFMYPREGEIGWGGAASTHFWISPKDKLIVITLTQFMPYNPRMEMALKPIIYKAIQKQND